MSLFSKALKFLIYRAPDERRLLAMRPRELSDIGLTRGDLARLIGGGVKREACCSI